LTSLAFGSLRAFACFVRGYERDGYGPGRSSGRPTFGHGRSGRARGYSSEASSAAEVLQSPGSPRSLRRSGQKTAGRTSFTVSVGVPGRTS